MHEKNRKQFQVTEELLATHKERFLNLFLDYIGQLFVFMIAFGIADQVAVSNGNKDFIANFINNEVAQYTFAAVVSLLYYNVFEIFTARTLGKFVTQTVVVDENGEKPHYETIMIRSLCRLIPFEILSFMLTPARGWHDILSKTYVVKKWELDQKKKKFYSLGETKNEGQLY